MLSTFFGWLRAAARDAVLDGVAEAGRVLTPDGDEPPDLDAMRARLAAALTPRALPAAEEKSRPAKKGGGA